MFLHPTILLVGALAAALPVLIHWLTRPKPRRLALSTIRFVRDAIDQRRTRQRLRDAVVLALRTSAVLLLALALARPLVNESSQAETGQDAASTVRVVLLDLSQSMAAQAGGISALEKGRSQAAEQLQFRPGLRANLIFAAARPQAVFTTPSNNFAALREALAGVSAQPERLLVQPALNFAAEMLTVSGGGDAKRELVVVSDFQRTNWTAADFSGLPADTIIHLRSVAPADAVGNVGLLRVGAGTRSAAGEEQRLEIEVGNYSSAARNIRATVKLGDATYELAGAAAAFSRTTLGAAIRPLAAGWHVGKARLIEVDDALAADNVRPCVLEVPEPPTYLLITRQTEKQQPSSSYYVQRALAPDEAPAGNSKRVLRLSPADLDNQSLGAADLLVLDHSGQLSTEEVGVLAGQMRRGRGLLYIAAEPTDAANLKLLSEELGGALQMPVEFQPTLATQPRRDLSWGAVRRDLPPFAIFGDELTSLTGPLRFSGGLASRRLTTGIAEDVRASFSDSSALVVVAASDAAPLAVLNADLERSNLPASPLFVPLIAELAQELMKRRSLSEFASGEPLVMSLTTKRQATSDYSIRGGPLGAESQRGEVLLEASGPLWRSSAAGPPAVYEVQQNDHTIAAAAVVIPSEESDLRPLAPEVLEKRLAGQRDVHFHAWSPRGGQRQDSLWTWLLVGCVACVVGELVMLRILRS